ncbi:flagellar basal body P-ring formation chaperone FlgA [Variovorax ginsengisoli]|uniref:Flagellar basal body P-ring formation chaperone FlgA n=1 Tax=Variovorax ginsengisoli TaxID=363844 RepID=A0ABT8SE18_9BURK|nr:flagellar basal body P-ring formation chaperone FlgA [Variovorax ginsengisoli]MDN8618006.1 flagellar basal body P-ring formation chaperone FlgA [Variovorax ginsengisoli]MDO1537176.1 flagellar basal body P-ring formation chaperone FlgA [Variovorax ginsengisoli]
MASAALAPDVAASIELRPKVSVGAGQVRLGDIAYLTTRDLPLLRQLMAMPIGAAPRVGSPVLVDRDTIKRWVSARSGGLDIQWAGASEAEVASAAQQVTGDVVEQAARSALERWLSERSVRAEVHPVSTARDLVLPVGTTTLRVRPLASEGMPSRRMLVWVDAWVDDRFVRSAAVSFEVEAWGPLAVAATQVDRGTPVAAVVSNGSVQQREVDLTTVRHGRPISAEVQDPAKEATAPQRLRRTLRAGEVLTQEHLETAPAVARGHWAALLARSGDVSIESRVEVLQDGRPGDVVRVKVPGSSGEVLARVTGRGQVEVQP